MTWTITERDKKLLKFLAVFVLIVGVGFGIILPIQEKALEVKSDLADAQMIKQQRELEGMRLAGVQAELQDQESRLEDARSTFYQNLSGLEVDRILTETAVGDSVVIRDLSIGAAEAASLKPYVAAPVTEETETAEQVQVDPTSQTDSETAEGVEQIPVTILLSGAEDELQAFLNGVADLEPAVRVSSFRWQRQEETLLQVSLLFYSIPEGE